MRYGWFKCLWAGPFASLFALEICPPFWQPRLQAKRIFFSKDTFGVLKMQASRILHCYNMTLVLWKGAFNTSTVETESWVSEITKYLFLWCVFHTREESTYGVHTWVVTASVTATEHNRVATLRTTSLGISSQLSPQMWKELMLLWLLPLLLMMPRGKTNESVLLSLKLIWQNYIDKSEWDKREVYRNLM